MRTTIILGSAFLLIAAACGGGDATGPGQDPPNGSMSARIDGSSWRAVGVSATRAASGGAVGIAGTDASGITLGMAWIDAGPGTYAVGQTSPTNAILTVGGGGWQAALNGGSGSISVTSISDTRVAGTFTFSLAAVPGTGANGTRSVTQGTFDIRF